MTRTLVLVALLAGCGDDPIDLSGTYQVQSHVGSSPCGTDTPVTMPAAYLKLEKMNFIADYFDVAECKDAAGTDCQSGGLFSGLFEPVDNGWRGVATTSSGLGGRCVLGYIEDTAILNGSHLVVEHHRYTDDTDRPESECTTDKAEELGTSMPCEEHEKIEAEKR
ncbi:MAG: hypothetical protein JNL83_02965 [Myxococcales bacterium]|nr:hypothetical protein [Myxococcales bacterium]